MSVSEVLVTGGTGVLGGRVVEHLGAGGVEARVLSRSGRSGTVRGDLLTGEGLDRAVRGVDTIIHCASSPFRKALQVVPAPDDAHCAGLTRRGVLASTRPARRATTGPGGRIERIVARPPTGAGVRRRA